MKNTKDKCGLKKIKDIHGLGGMSVQDLKTKVKLLYPYMTNIHKMKREELCQLLGKDCKVLGGLVNKNNSCYLDSILIGLFHAHNPYIRKVIFDTPVHHDDTKLQEEATKIQKLLRGVYGTINRGNRGACSHLRLAFQNFDKRYSEVVAHVEHLDWKNSQLEPADVVKQLIRVFNIPNDCKYIIQNYTKVKRKKVLVNEETVSTTFADPIITPDILYGKKYVDLREYIPNEISHVKFDEDNKWKPIPGVEYDNKISIKKYIKAPLLSIHIQRVFGDSKLKTPVIPAMTIKLKGSTLHLRSILVHEGSSTNYGHYVAYILCQKKWYLYNDLGFEKMELVGSHDKMFRINKHYILKNMTQLLYW
jgi:ubiquitin C-terminal hydrolase